jgi:hypothetical protein
MTWRATVRRGTAIALAGAVMVVACTGDDADADRSGRDDEGPSATGGDAGPARSVVRRPTEPTTVVPGEGAIQLAVAATGALFDTAPLVVLAPEDDPSAQSRAAARAVELGMPLLLAPAAPAAEADPGPDAAGDDAGSTASPPTTSAAAAMASVAVADELERLDTTTVLAIGDAAAAWAEGVEDGPEVVEGAARPEPATGPDSDDAGDLEISGEGDAGAGADADADVPEATGEEDRDRSGDGPAADDLPDVEPGDLLGDGLLVVVGTDQDSVAATITARASGARVLRLASGDPRADTAAIELLTERPPPDQVLAIGSRFGTPERLRRRLDVASTGWQLPGGGQVLFPGRRMIALYGHPGTAALGVLGEQPLEAAIARAQALARSYDELVERPVVPTFEIIATVASAAAGPDGNYANEGDVEELRPWVDAAGDAGVYVVLDIQPGRTDFLTEAQRYEDLLLEPHVGLALDPEWRLGPTQVHLDQIGTVSAAEVNDVADWLAQLTRNNQLPQKLLLLHQFRPQMIGDRGQLDTGHDELAVLIHADGFGTHAQKLGTWNRLQAGAPARVWWGWKNFIDEDAPMMTPEETLAVTPQVLFVSYQ